MVRAVSGEIRPKTPKTPQKPAGALWSRRGLKPKNGKNKDILINYPINSILVRVRKPHAPVKGVLDTVEVELKRTKEDYA